MSGGTILKHLNEYGRDDVERIVSGNYYFVLLSFIDLGQLFEIAQGLAYLHSQYVIHGDLRGVVFLLLSFETVYTTYIDDSPTFSSMRIGTFALQILV